MGQAADREGVVQGQGRGGLGAQEEDRREAQRPRRPGNEGAVA